jgi:hypothetical protein
MADLIDGSMGEYSKFHETHGVYAHGIGPETAVLPTGWKTRLVKIQTPQTDLRIGYCLDIHDLAASKLAASREKDYEFVEEMFRSRLIDASTLRRRVALLSRPPAELLRLDFWVKGRMAKLGINTGTDQSASS